MKDLGSEFEGVSDDVYYLIAENKVYQPYVNTPWYKKIKKQFKDVTDGNAKDYARDCLERVREMLGNQYFLLHTKNAWILKPGGKSRGRGITIHNKLGDIVNTIQQSIDENIWVV